MAKLPDHSQGCDCAGCRIPVQSFAAVSFKSRELLDVVGRYVLPAQVGIEGESHWRAKVRTLLVVVTLAAVGSWVYWIGWPWWQTNVEQQRLVAWAKQIKVGMTPRDYPQIEPGRHCAEFHFEGELADRPAIIMESYAWKDCIYCVYYECVGGFGSNYAVGRPFTKIEVWQLAPMPQNYRSPKSGRFIGGMSGIPQVATWFSNQSFNYPFMMAQYIGDFAGFIVGDRKTNPGFQCELIYSDPPAKAIR